ncbi:Uncharacterized protein FWK35_00037381, partial [Aphis craccivora]
RIFGRVGELVDQRLKVGSVAYLQHQQHQYLYYLVTKVLSNSKLLYSSITATIIQLKNLTIKHGVTKLALSRIGCGLDQMDWPIIKGFLQKHFKSINIKIKICHFKHMNVLSPAPASKVFKKH